MKTIAGNFYSATYNSDSNDDKEVETETGTRPFISKANKLPVTLLASSRDQSIGHSKNQFSLSAALSFQDDTNCMNNNGMTILESNGKETMQ